MEINERRDALYEKAFASVNPCNILGQAMARFPEAAPKDPYFPHFPPVRYPDLTSIPGLVKPGPVPGRSALLSKTIEANPVDPCVMDIDSMGTNQVTGAPDRIFDRWKFPPASQLAGAPTGWD
jgi:hypothetical protein